MKKKSILRMKFILFTNKAIFITESLRYSIKKDYGLRRL